MKQILQNLGSGETLLADVPCPRRGAGSVLIQTSKTLVSLGTEKMLIDFGKGGFLAKARSQPDKVKQVLQKVKTDGLFTTIDAVRSKLDTPITLGYCNAGVVVEADEDSGLSVGDRVISSGPHAEMVAIPKNLTAIIPDEVSNETAAFTVVGAIGLQGIRLMQPTLGEKIVVSGLGLIGLMCVQMLRAHGCQVLGIDFDAKKLELARQFGAQTVDLSADQDPVKIANEWTDGHGVDGVLVTASTKSDELIHQAATMCRKRGRIVLVGVIGLNLRRSDFYEKELSFQVSCSYGPGRYETNYEGRGMDYPIGFVRWTEQRNFQAVLDLMAEGKIDVAPLITHRFSFDDALDGYKAVNEKGALGIVLDYGESEKPSSEKAQRNIVVAGNEIAKKKGDVGVAFIGAGNFATRTLLPQMPSRGVFKKTIVSGTGVSAAYAGKKFGFQEVSTDSDQVFNDPDVDAVFITTRHNSHCRFVCQALDAGKHVFVEKPLAMNIQELDTIVEKMNQHPQQCVMVGFNRRFSPHSVEIKKWLQSSPGPKSIMITVNAGAIPADHWTQDRSVGGGRIIGEACHFVDLATFFAGTSIRDTQAMAMGGTAGQLGDCASLQISYDCGSIATINYLANGSKDFPKERIEIFAGGRVFACDNFRSSREIGGKGKLKTSNQDKGHAAEVAAFINAISSGSDGNSSWPIAANELVEVSRATIELDESIQNSLAR